MKVGVPRETAAGERRVALVPETVKRLVGSGFEVAVERGAGEPASFPDRDYEEAGAAIGEDAFSAEAHVRVQPPSADEAGGLREGQILIGFLQPLTDREGIDRLTQRGVIAFAMESIPRITRAQAMDALSSQATVSGYKAAILAADRLPKFFPMLMTAAGTVAPAKVLVLGAGGNCELTEPGDAVVRENVTILGYTNLPSTMPFHASQLYSRNVFALLQHLAPEGQLNLDWEDEITASACVTRKEEVAA